LASGFSNPIFSPGPHLFTGFGVFSFLVLLFSSVRPGVLPFFEVSLFFGSFSLGVLSGETFRLDRYSLLETSCLLWDNVKKHLSVGGRALQIPPVFRDLHKPEGSHFPSAVVFGHILWRKGMFVGLPFPPGSFLLASISNLGSWPWLLFACSLLGGQFVPLAVALPSPTWLPLGFLSM